MKRWNVLITCVIVAILMSFCHIEQAEAKKRAMYKTITIPIQKGKTYQLCAFMKTLEKEYAESATEHFYSIRRAIKKGKKVTLSGKGLTIKKKTFKAKKTGEYKLKVKVKNKYYVFSFCAVEKIYKLKPNEISKIIVSAQSNKVLWPRPTVEVVDRETINEIVKKINQAKYLFDFSESLLSQDGFWGHYVNLYASDGNLIKELMLGSYGHGFRENDNKYIYWKTDSYLAKDCYDYIVKVYNDGLLGSEGQSQ